MACKPGDLVLIPFPFSDLQSTKKRPVMVLTPPDRHADFIGLAITTVEQQHHALQVGPANLIEGALPKPSWIRLDKVFTFSESSIVKTFGTLSPHTVQSALKGALRGRRLRSRINRDHYRRAYRHLLSGSAFPDFQSHHFQPRPTKVTCA